MLIKNISGFTEYCQAQHERPELPVVVEAAEDWADSSDILSRQYGGHGQSYDEWIELAHRRMEPESREFADSNITTIHDVLSQFWEHGDAFHTWFSSIVIVSTPVE